MIIVTGGVLAKPETQAELHAISLAHVHRSRAEPGCISHHVHTSVEQPLRLFFFERWESMEALQTHFAVPASREFGRQLVALAAEPPFLHIYQAEQVTPAR
jgi:quinol monooxygenase YgiN